MLAKGKSLMLATQSINHQASLHLPLSPPPLSLSPSLCHTHTRKEYSAMPSSPQTLFSVAGKNVLVTGGSRGIGAMIAKGFQDAGANVLLTSRSEEAIRKASETIPGSRYVTSNVSSRQGCEALAQQVAEIFDDRLDVLINNAGTSWGEPLERQSGRANWGFDKVSWNDLKLQK